MANEPSKSPDTTCSRPGMRSCTAVEPSDPARRYVGQAKTLVRAVNNHRMLDGRQSASQQRMCSLDGRCFIECRDDQRFRWSAPMWSPPPESNRRPHPYHGTTGNRCANRRFPRSRPTVRAEVMGSLSAKLCVLAHPRSGLARPARRQGGYSHSTASGGRRAVWSSGASTRASGFCAVAIRFEKRAGRLPGRDGDRLAAEPTRAMIIGRESPY
jgi:hypothetical protein